MKRCLNELKKAKKTKTHVQDLVCSHIVPMWEVLGDLNSLPLKRLIVFALNGRLR